MECRETQSLLTAFHDGEIRDSERTRVEEHLRGCPDCSRLLADLARADGIAGVPDPGPAYWDRFNARVADRIRREAEGPNAAVLRPKRGWMRQQLRYLVPAVAAAALVVVVVRFGGYAPFTPSRDLPTTEPVKERSVPDSAERRAAGSEQKSLAAKRTEEAAKSPRAPADSDRAVPAPAAPPAAVTPDGFAAATREPSHLPADRTRSDETGRTLRDRSAAPFESDAPSFRPLPAGQSATTPSPATEAAEGRPPIAQTERERSAEAAPSGTESKVAGKEESAFAGSMAKAGPSRLSTDAARAASPCRMARDLAARGRLGEAEAAQRECLATDPSPAVQEKGLVFLAELLDRQARFAEADEVLADVHAQFPESRTLNLYRQQRPMVQKQQVPVPAAR